MLMMDPILFAKKEVYGKNSAERENNVIYVEKRWCQQLWCH